MITRWSVNSHVAVALICAVAGLVLIIGGSTTNGVLFLILAELKAQRG